MSYKVYGRSDCYYTNEARKLLQARNIDFVFTEVKYMSPAHIKLHQQTTQETVPYIFEMENGSETRFVGGYTQLAAELVPKPRTRGLFW